MDVPKSHRRYLVYIALYFAGWMAVAFEYIAENSDYHFERRRLWVAAIFSVPVWLPVLIPNRLALLSSITRWLCALCLLFYLRMWGPLVAYTFGSVLAGKASLAVVGFVSSTAGAVGCIVAMALLVRPEIVSFLQRTRNKSVEPTADPLRGQ